MDAEKTVSRRDVSIAVIQIGKAQSTLVGLQQYLDRILDTHDLDDETYQVIGAVSKQANLLLYLAMKRLGGVPSDMYWEPETEEDEGVFAEDEAANEAQS